MKEQFAAYNKDTNSYVPNKDGKFVFDDYDSLEKMVEASSQYSSVVIYRREVTDWEVKGEIIKDVL